MKIIKVFMVDDHQTMTEGLGEYFRVISNEECTYQVVGRVKSGVELLQRIGQMPGVDVILMDLEMPEMSGFELIEAVLKITPDIPILILTMHNSWSFANTVIKKGARGYALKTSGGKVITEAIQLILQQKIFIDPGINPGGTETVPVEWNPEDRRIICEILKEKTSQEIGAMLGRTEEYIEGRRRNIMRTTGAKNVIGIVKYAIRKKLCPETMDGLFPTLASARTKEISYHDAAPIKVLLVDDHALLLDSLEAMLRLPIQGSPVIDVVGKAHSGKEALDIIGMLGPPDVILLDKEMADMNGIELAIKIREQWHKTQMVMLSFDDSGMAKEAAMAAGIAKYLVKTKASRVEIATAIAEVASGKTASNAIHPSKKTMPFEALDQHILQQMLAEINNEKIAEHLGISVSTVAHRRAKMMEIVGVKSVVGLIIYAIKTGQISV